MPGPGNPNNPDNGPKNQLNLENDDLPDHEQGVLTDLDELELKNFRNKVVIGTTDDPTTVEDEGNTTISDSDGLQGLLGDIAGEIDEGDPDGTEVDADDVRQALEEIDVYDDNETPADTSDDEAELGDVVALGEGNDQMWAGSGNDVILGQGGNDVLRGEAGNDALFGGEGNDVLDGGEGDDYMAGGTGNDTYHVDSSDDVVVENEDEGNDTVHFDVAEKLDLATFSGGNIENAELGPDGTDLFGNDEDNTLTGNDNPNTIVGRGGNDTIDGQGGNDILVGDNVAPGVDGDDTIYGGAGQDLIYGDDWNGDPNSDVSPSTGASADDTIYGEGDNDTIYAGAGDDYVEGGDGDDEIHGNSGDDELYGNAGDDDIFGRKDDDLIEGGAGADDIDGGSGTDTASYENAGEGVEVDLSLGAAAQGDGVGDSDEDGDTLVSIENLRGSEFVDTLTGDGDANRIEGLGGADVIDGGEGNDTLLGGDGADDIDGGNGDDYINGGAGVDNLLGGDGADTIYGGTVVGDNDTIDLGTDSTGTVGDFFNRDGFEDVVVAADNFGNNGTDTVFNYGDNNNAAEADTIDLSDAFQFDVGTTTDEEREDDLTAAFTVNFDANSAEITDGANVWFDLHEDADGTHAASSPESVQVEADGFLFEWNNGDTEWDLLGPA